MTASSENRIDPDQVFYTSDSTDPIGRVFFWKNRVFRGIHAHHVPDILQLLHSDLYRELLRQNLVVSTSVTSYKLQDFALVLEHERIEPVLRQATWTFDMIKDAALTVLKINKIALPHDYQFADAGAKNFVFDGTQPKLIDIGALYKITSKKTAWLSYEYFLKTYYYPLVLMAEFPEQDIRKRFGKANFFFIPHHVFYAIRHPKLRKVSPAFIEFIVHHFCRSLVFCHETRKDFLVLASKPSRYAMRAIRLFNLAWFYRVDTERLRKKIELLHFPGEDKTRNLPGRKPFEFAKPQEELTAAQAYVLDYVNRFKIREIIEVSDGMGSFTCPLLNCRSVRRIICLESDEATANTLFGKAKQHKLPVTVARMDVDYPNMLRRGLSPDIHYRADAVVALNITEKYSKSRYWPAENMMKMFSEWTSEYLFVEFSEPARFREGEHSNAESCQGQMEDLYSAFTNRFSTLHEIALETGRKLLIGKVKKSEPKHDLSQNQTGDNS